MYLIYSQLPSIARKSCTMVPRRHLAVVLMIGKYVMTFENEIYGHISNDDSGKFIVKTV